MRFVSLFFVKMALKKAGGWLMWSSPSTSPARFSIESRCILSSPAHCQEDLLAVSSRFLLLSVDVGQWREARKAKLNLGDPAVKVKACMESHRVDL